MQLSRLGGRKVVDRVRRRGATWKGKHMKMVYSFGRDQKSEIRNQLFVGTLASTHLDKSAVKRNRMRRRCREALRTILISDLLSLTSSVQLLISPRSSSLECPFEELREDCRAFLTHLSRHA